MVQEIERLRGKIVRMTTDYSSTSLQGMVPEEDDESDNESLWKIAWESFRRGFTLTYFARAGKSHQHLCAELVIVSFILPLSLLSHEQCRKVTAN